MKKIIFLALGFFMLTGCVNKTIIPLKPQTNSQLRDKSFTFVKRTLPTQPFVMTPSKAILIGMTGGIGGAMVEYNFAVSQEDNSTKVPSYFLNSNLKKHIEKQYKMNFIDNNITIKNKTNIEDLIKLYKTDYLLDSQDLLWQVTYFPTHWGTYRVLYFNKLKLIDVKKGNVIAEGYCEYIPEYNESLPSYDKMFENSAKLVKQYTQQALDICLKKYVSEVFK